MSDKDDSIERLIGQLQEQVGFWQGRYDEANARAESLQTALTEASNALTTAGLVGRCFPEELPEYVETKVAVIDAAITENTAPPVGE
jgi:hypothetical protein